MKSGIYVNLVTMRMFDVDILGEYAVVEMLKKKKVVAGLFETKWLLNNSEQIMYLGNI
jgi:hypothetical protein